MCIHSLVNSKRKIWSKRRRLPRIISLLPLAISLIGCSPKGEQAESASGSQTQRTRNPDGTDPIAATDSPVASDSESIAFPEETKDVPTAKENPPQNEESKYQRAEAIEKAQAAFSLDVASLREGIVERYELQSLENSEQEISYLLNKYESGDDSVALDLALLLAHVGRTPQQIEQAKEILKIAAADGETRAYSELARLVLLGDTEQIDPYEVIEYLEKSVEAQDPEGTYLLGVANRLSLVPGATHEIGMELLATAAELGHANAAKAIFSILSEIASADGATSRERKANLTLLLEDYPEMENWLINATENGDPTDFNVLAKYYHNANQPHKRNEVTRIAAELGSYDALQALIRSDRKIYYDDQYRSSMQDVVTKHIDGDPDSDSRPYLVRAHLTLLIDQDPMTLESAKHDLQKSVDLGNWVAGVALLKIEQGDNPLAAIYEAENIGENRAYSVYQELLREKNAASSANHPPFPKFWGEILYPPELYAEAIEGQVIIQAIIDIEGRLLNPTIESSTHPAFEPYALESLEGSVFEPAIKDGKPVPSEVRIPINFRPTR